MSNAAAQTALTRTRQPGTAALIAALEDAWRSIQHHHPDVPAGSGHRRPRLRPRPRPAARPPRTRALAARPAQPDALIHELLIAGEGLALGADDVFTTELHEAAHALAVARAIADTSRDGRYHNAALQAARRGARP